jgi:hypothetical protein
MEKKSNWISRLRNDAKGFVEYSDNLEAKLEYALSALKTISLGAYYKEDGDPEAPAYDNLKASAAGALERMAKMKCRKRPPTYYF